MARFMLFVVAFLGQIWVGTCIVQERRPCQNVQADPKFILPG